MQDEPVNPNKRLGRQVAVGLLGAGALAAAAFIRGRKLRKVAPELRSLGLAVMPGVPPVLAPLMRGMTRRRAGRTLDIPGVRISQQWVRSETGDPDVRVLIVEREGGSGPRPALLWLHGGGYVLGTPEIDKALLARILEGADVTIVSVDYRLAPRDPFPAPLDDAMAALRWTIDRHEELGIDPERIAVGGISAGGGLAAAVAQRARDEGIKLRFQLLMYPMIDDRTACRTDHKGRGELVWSPRSNHYGWASYLGHAPGIDQILPYAAPARTEQLAGLPPAWIGVGTLDLFHDEDVEYADRLSAADVACGIDVVEGAPHGFDLFNFDTNIVRRFHAGMITALRSALDLG